jgi:hypothetical protein
MALPPTSNEGTQYYNKNQCRSFEQQISTSLVRLSGGAAGGFPCSEVIIKGNHSGGVLFIYDRAELYTASVPEDEYRWPLSAGEEFTFRGLTNVDQVSAKMSAGTAVISYRTQFFSTNPA